MAGLGRAADSDATGGVRGVEEEARPAGSGTASLTPGPRPRTREPRLRSMPPMNLPPRLGLCAGGGTGGGRVGAVETSSSGGGGVCGGGVGSGGGRGGVAGGVSADGCCAGCCSARGRLRESVLARAFDGALGLLPLSHSRSGYLPGGRVEGGGGAGGKFSKQEMGAWRVAGGGSGGARSGRGGVGGVGSCSVPCCRPMPHPSMRTLVAPTSVGIHPQREGLRRTGEGWGCRQETWLANLPVSSPKAPP